MATVRIPPILRPEAGNNRQVELSGATIRDVLENLIAEYPSLRERLFDGRRSAPVPERLHRRLGRAAAERPRHRGPGRSDRDPAARRSPAVPICSPERGTLESFRSVAEDRTRATRPQDLSVRVLGPFCVGPALKRPPCPVTRLSRKGDQPCSCDDRSSIPNLAEPRRQRLAADRRDARRPDERPRPRRALRRRHAEALVREQHDARVLRLRGRPDRLGALRASTWASAIRGTALLTEVEGSSTASSGTSSGSRVPSSTTRPSKGRRSIPLVGGPRLALPAVHARLLPVRVRGDHAAADARLDSRPDQLQGVARLRPALDLGRLRRERVPDLGRRLLRPAGRDRLLGRLRDPSRRRCRRVRRSCGDRPTTRP